MQAGRGKIPIFSLHPGTHGTEPVGTNFPGDAGRNQRSQTLTDGVGTGVK